MKKMEGRAIICLLLALGLVLGLASSKKSTPAQMYVVDCFIANKSYDEADVPKK